MLCRAGQNHRLSSAPPSIDSLQEKDIEAILGIVCSNTSMPSIWGVRCSFLASHSVLSLSTVSPSEH